MKKLYTLMAAATLSLSSWAGTLYVCGDGTGLGWTPTSPKEIVSDTEQYEFTIANLTSFKMSTAKGDWNTFNGGAIGYSGTIEADKTLKIVSWGENQMAPWTGDWTINVDLAAKTMIMTTTTPKPTGYTKLYIRGGMNGWGATAAWELQTEDGVVYTLDNVDITAGQTFKVADANWGADNYGSVKNMETGKAYKLTKSPNSSDCTMKETVSNGKVTFNRDTYEFRVDVDTPELIDCLVYWDNREAQWDAVYAYVSTADGEELDAFPGNEMQLTSVDGIYSYTVPGGYSKIVFNDGSDANKSAEYNVENNYIYSMTNSGSEYEAPKDFTGWYVNVPGEFNAWSDNGVPVDAKTGIATLTLNDVAGNFKVKIWNGAETWYSNGSPLVADTWTSLAGLNVDPGMTMPADLQSGSVKVEFNCNTEEIRVSSTKIDLSGYYVNIVGPFNNWEATGVQPNVETGIASAVVDDMTAEGFKIKVWTGTADVWYCNGQLIPVGSWVKITNNEEALMTVSEDLLNHSLDFEFNVLTGELRIVDNGLSAINGIEADEDVAPVYYNLQGVKVDNPVNGIFVEVRGSKAVKVIR